MKQDFQASIKTAQAKINTSDMEFHIGKHTAGKHTHWKTNTQLDHRCSHLYQVTGLRASLGPIIMTWEPTQLQMAILHEEVLQRAKDVEREHANWQRNHIIHLFFSPTQLDHRSSQLYQVTGLSASLIMKEDKTSKRFEVYSEQLTPKIHAKESLPYRKATPIAPLALHAQNGSFITDRIRRMREGNVFSLSTPVWGGGGVLPRPGPDGEAVPQPGLGRGGTPPQVPPPWVPPSDLDGGTPAMGVPHLGYPPSRPGQGVPLPGGYPTSGTPSPPSDLAGGTPAGGGVPHFR